MIRRFWLLSTFQVGGSPVRSRISLPTYDIMNRVYLNTIAVKGGNFDEIHSYHIDLMLQTYLHEDSLEPLDVMDVLWNDLWMADDG